MAKPSKSLTPEQLSARGRAGASKLHASHDTKEFVARTAARGFKEKFEREVDPERVLSPYWRRKYRDELITVYMQQMALRRQLVNRLGKQNRFLQFVDPDEVLPEVERVKRATRLIKAELERLELVRLKIHREAQEHIQKSRRDGGSR